MTTLEDLMESERGAVDPSPEEVARVRRRVHGALMVSAGLATSTVVGTASAKGGALTKLGSFLGLKSAWLWGASAATGIGLGYAVVQVNAPAQMPPAAPPPEVPEVALIAPPEEPAPQVVEEEPEASETPEPEETAPERTVVPRQKRAPQSPADRLRDDARRLSKISAALNRGAPNEALRLLGAVRIAGSPLATEFQAARAIALCQTGQRGAARGFVRSLQKTAPQSPTLLRVRRACGLQE